MLEIELNKLDDPAESFGMWFVFIYFTYYSTCSDVETKIKQNFRYFAEMERKNENFH